MSIDPGQNPAALQSLIRSHWPSKHEEQVQLIAPVATLRLVRLILPLLDGIDSTPFKTIMAAPKVQATKRFHRSWLQDKKFYMFMEPTERENKPRFTYRSRFDHTGSDAETAGIAWVSCKCNGQPEGSRPLSTMLDAMTE